MRLTFSICALLALLMAMNLATPSRAAENELAWVVYEGGEGPGEGKHIMLVSGDDEYRSEEALPMLGKILAKHHGFKCTVLFAIDPETGEIKPDLQDNIPGLEALRDADLMVLFTRFRRLPLEQLQPIREYVQTGRPIVGLRTATHAFNYPKDPGHDVMEAWDWKSDVAGFKGGFGRLVLGETWVAHHGTHGKESTRGIIAPGQEGHPIVQGCEDIWGPTDVYRVNLPLPGDSEPLVLGQVLVGMEPDDVPVEGPKNDPMMPVAWTKTYQFPGGKQGRAFCTTMGASQDFLSEGMRRLVVNACYWGLGMENKIPERTNVEIVGEYEPTEFGFGDYQEGVHPRDHLWSE